MTEPQRLWLRQLPVEGRIKNRLRIAMVLIGVDNTELARRTDLQDQYISAVATGRLVNISLRNAQRIATALGLTIDDVFPGNPDEEDTHGHS